MTHSPYHVLEDNMPPEIKKGDRVRLMSTTDRYTQLRPGTQGTVTSVDDLGTVHVEWDDGSRLGMVPFEDWFEVID